MSANDPKERESRGKGEGPLQSPYGPNPTHVDEAAGGADSSPLENAPSGEKEQAAQETKRHVPGQEAEQV